MKVSLCISASLVAIASAQPYNYKAGNDSTWSPPGPGDVRSPCPMLNTLANHHFINHNGKNITRDQVNFALTQVLNFDIDGAGILFGLGMSTTKNPNGTHFDFADVNQHDLLEHDGSLSRADAFFGNAVSFSPASFAETKAYFTEPILDLQHTGNARLARMYTANATNPTFGLTDTGRTDSFAETVLYMSVLGNFDERTVPRDYVEYLFEKERLPYAIGWARRNNTVINLQGVVTYVEELFNLTGGSFPLPNSAPNHKRSHF